MPEGAIDRRIRKLRPPKPAVDPWVTHGSMIEDERRPDGTLERALTIFLAGSECPFTCSFCDLWRWTIDGPTPRGALPTQIASVLESLEHPWPERLKLYNASNFFDRRAVPVDDLPAIAELARSFSSVTVESHANTIGDQTLAFARSIGGRLEVAIGLETIHPDAMRHLNKRLDLARFEQAARFLSANRVDLRAFVLLGVPHVPEAASVEWTVRSAQYAANCGAAVVALIPVRGGNGEMDRLHALGQFSPPSLIQLEAALDLCVAGGPASTAYTADLWDIDRLPACARCRHARVARLRRVSTTGRSEPPIDCLGCRGQ